MYQLCVEEHASINSVEFGQFAKKPLWYSGTLFLVPQLLHVNLISVSRRILLHVVNSVEMALHSFLSVVKQRSSKAKKFP